MKDTHKLSAIRWHIGHTLRRVRHLDGLTQADLVERAGVAASQVSRLEDKGEASLAVMTAIADVLGVEIGDALNYTTELNTGHEIPERKKG